MTRDDRVDVGDWELMKSRLLSRKCGTCVFRPGNLMDLGTGRLKDLVDQAMGKRGFVVCHDTLPHGQFPDAKPAICRGFFEGYTTDGLQLIERLFGFVEVDPPCDEETT